MTFVFITLLHHASSTPKLTFLIYPVFSCWDMYKADTNPQLILGKTMK